MKIIVIGDTHGRSVWKQIVLKERFDLIIFIGDYWDSFDIQFEEQAKNFLDIIQYKKDNPKQVILLFGNHDFHYLGCAMDIYEQYSGFQERMAFVIRGIVETHKEHLQMAYQEGEYLFTHAGVTKTWLDNYGYETSQPVDVFINELFIHKPLSFAFTGSDPYGDSIYNSPIWVRPRSLNEDAYPATHVVGHTGMARIGIEATKFQEDGSGFFIDVLGNINEYLIIEDGKPSIGRL